MTDIAQSANPAPHSGYPLTFTLEIMKLTFIAAIQKIKVTEDLGIGDKIGDLMRISNNKELKSKFLTSAFRDMVGSLEYNGLHDCKTYLYSVTETNDDINSVDFLTSEMYFAQNFLMASWLHKDNCANFEMCFLIREDVHGYGVTSNFLAHRYCAADRSLQDVEFSRDELRSIRRTHIDRFGVKNEQLPLPDSQFKDDNSRIGRALTWINAARGSLDYSIRVANFCTAFETLFSTTHNEIAHQLSERISIFLESELTKRVEIYQILKRAYELRSRIVHGSTTTQTATKNPELISQEVEFIARRIVTKIIENDGLFESFNKSNEKLNSAMLSMVLSGIQPIDNF